MSAMLRLNQRLKSYDEFEIGLHQIHKETGTDFKCRSSKKIVPDGVDPATVKGANLALKYKEVEYICVEKKVKLQKGETIPLGDPRMCPVRAYASLSKDLKELIVRKIFLDQGGHTVTAYNDQDDVQQTDDEEAAAEPLFPDYLFPEVILNNFDESRQDEVNGSDQQHSSSTMSGPAQGHSGDLASQKTTSAPKTPLNYAPDPDAALAQILRYLNLYFLNYKDKESVSKLIFATDKILLEHRNKNVCTKSEMCDVSTQVNLYVHSDSKLSLDKTDKLSVETTDKLSVETTDNVSVETTDNVSVETTDNVSVKKTDNLELLNEIKLPEKMRLRGRPKKGATKAIGLPVNKSKYSNKKAPEKASKDN